MSSERPEYRFAEESRLRIGLFAFVSTFATGLISLALTQRLSHLCPIWWSNGVLLALALASRRNRWPLLLVTGGLGILLAHLVVYGLLTQFFWLTACNLFEVWLAAWLLLRWVKSPFDLTNAAQQWRFIIVAVLFTPFVSGVLAILLSHMLYGSPWSTALFQWYIPDALGVATATPVTLALYRGYAQNILREKKTERTLLLLLMLAAVTVFCMLQPSVPLLFILFPVLLVVVVQLGWIGGGIGVCVIALIASAFTAFDYGPFAQLDGVSTRIKTLDLQLFLACAALSATVVSTIFDERRKLLQLTVENEKRFRSLAENSPDVMVLSDLTGRRLYVSAAVTPLLGWSPRELLGKTFQMDMVHPEDIALLSEALEDVRRLDVGRTLTYRCQRKDGEYIWVEASVNLYRDSQTHEPIGFVNVVRDISSRKAAEDRLYSAYEELQTLASVDALTGVANRRHFDNVLDAEWKRAIRTGAPTALLLIDVDCFKNYNDIYGHLQGDTCLRDLATWITRSVRRSSDLVARFGGEEFAVILPDTDEKGAADLAERIRSDVAEKLVDHEGNAAGIVTISAGCAALIPIRGTNSLQLIEAADKALYRAKSRGRNVVVRASGEREPANR